MFYTIMIVPSRSAKVRRLQISQRFLRRLAVALCGFVAVLMLLLVHYVYTFEQARQSHRLKDENFVLKTRFRVLQDEINRVETTLARIEQLAMKVRAITQLHDPDRNLAIGPLQDDLNAKPPEVLYARGERIDYEDEILDSQLAIRMLDASVDQANDASLRQEDSLRYLHDYLQQKPQLLATTPSIRPTRSKLLSSGYGPRTDMYTDQQVLHKGVDIAAEEGEPVFAPAAGRVVYVGDRGNGYGKMVVLDHGFAVQTHFAHLADYQVTVGQRVERGETIATVGNTGRSAGPHLHYEVRFGGIPQNPEKFMLDSL